MNKGKIRFKSPYKYLVLIFILNLWCLNVSAYVVNTTTEGAEIKWNAFSVTYYINTSGGPAGSLDAIQAAMQTWTDVATSSFVFVYAGTTASTDFTVYDQVNIVGFESFGTTGSLAENSKWYYVNTGEILDSDIRFNTDYPWNTDGSSNAYDVWNAGTHEFGHSLSLDDLYDAADSEKTMYSYGLLGETKKRTLDQDDIDGITYLYPYPDTIWTGAGADNLASNPSNWLGGVLPRDGRDVIFNGTSTKNCIWDIYIMPASLTLDTGYSGEVTLIVDLTVTGDVIITDGVINQNDKNFKIGFTAAEVLTTTSSIGIDLSWTNNSDNETGFKIERKTGVNGIYAQINTVGANATTYSDTGLTQGTTYSNEADAPISSTSPPTATTDPATDINGNTATLNATVSPNNSETTVCFEWGTDTSYGNTTTSVSIGSGSTGVGILVDLAGLSTSTTYHYRVAASNYQTSYGDDMSFTTPPITLTITSPLDGAAISRADVMVEGTVSNTASVSITVTADIIISTFSR